MSPKLFSALRIITARLSLLLLVASVYPVESDIQAKSLTPLRVQFSSIKAFTTTFARLQPNPRRKRALLIGISNYERAINDGAAWKNLVAKNDLELVVHVLMQKFQFDPEDIKIISDVPIALHDKVISPVMPTRKVIIDAFRTFLIEQTRKDDIVFFYFAGHGSQLPDDNGDELDGLDETLVPIDYISTKDGSNDIRDDEIGDLLDELGRKSPSNITIAIDSCFSGTATRGDYDVIRGGLRVVTPAKKQGILIADESINDSLTRGANSERQPLRNYVFLSAASSRQKAMEKVFHGKKYGVFTYAFARAMQASGPKTTYRDIYEKVLSEVHGETDQQPQIEGDQIDNLFLQDGAMPTESYIPVTVNKYGIFLSAGTLQGMTVGSRFALFPPSTKSRSEGKPIAQALITEVRATDSTLEIEEAFKKETMGSSARAFEVSRNYERILKVALKDTGNLAGLSEMLSGLGLAMTAPESGSDWNVLIRGVVQADRDEKLVPEHFKGVILQRRDSRSIFARIQEGKEMISGIRDALISEARRISLKSLDNTDSDIKVEIRLIPVEVEWEENSLGRAKINKVIGDKKEGLQYSKNGNIEFKVNDWYRVEVRNISHSEIDVYVSILNLDAGGKISPFFPVNGEDNLIKRAAQPGNKNDGWMQIRGRYIRVTGSPGIESMRAIATREKTDFSPLFDSATIARGNERGSSFIIELLKEVEERNRSSHRGGEEAAERLQAAMRSPLGQIFIATQEGKGVRGASAYMPPPSWSTVAVNYVVVK